MFRTTRIDLGTGFHFYKKYKRLLLPLCIFLSGFVIGCILFCGYGKTESAFLGRVLTLAPVEKGLSGILSALYNTCFLPILLLAVLFCGGLCACGAPLILAVPFFFGLGLGMSESYYYSTGWQGVLLTVTVVLPPVLIKGTALLLGTMEGLRMSLCIGGVLLQKNGTLGLYQDLKVFVLRFLVFALLAIAGGILDVLLRFWIL